jgi:hypothetical protein
VSEQHAATDLHLHEVNGVRLFVALWGGLALLDLARLVGAAPLVQLGAISLLVAGCSLRVTRAVAVSVALIGWLLLNGFVVHRYGQLGFVGVGDLVRALLLLGVALTVAGLRR